MTDSHLSHASTTSLNSTFLSLMLCPQCIYRPLPYLSLFCCEKQNLLISFINAASPSYSLALSCTCSCLNLSSQHESLEWHMLFLVLGINTHWKNPPWCNSGIATLFFFSILVSQKNLWAVNSLQSLSSAVPNLVQLVALPQVSCMSSGISLHLSVSQFLICRSKQMLPFLSALSGWFGVDALKRGDWLQFYSHAAASVISVQSHPAMQCNEQKETQWFLPLCSLLTFNNLLPCSWGMGIASNLWGHALTCNVGL